MSETSEIFNKLGIEPVWIRVLLLPDTVEETVGESGILFKPRCVIEKEDMTQIRATVIGIGGNAFDEFSGRIPQPGEKVLIDKYAGSRMTLKDGKEYRIVNGGDIIAVISNEY